MDNNLEVTTSLTLKTWQRLVNGEHPVVIRVNHNRKRKYVGTGVSCPSELWDKDRQEIIGKKRDSKKADAKLKEVNNVILKMERLTDTFTFEMFYKILEPDKTKTVFTDFWERMIKSHYRKMKRDGTADSYEDALKKFIKFQGNRRYGLEEITPELLNSFKEFMMTGEKPQRLNGVGIYLRSLNAVYGLALKKGLVKPDTDPRSNIKIKREKTAKKALTRSQLDLIITLDLADKQHWVESRHLFMLSYYMQGINFKDMCELKWNEHIIGDRIVYSRDKTTEDMFSIKIRPSIMLILDYLRARYERALADNSIRNSESKDRILRVFDNLTDSQNENPRRKKAVRNQRAKLLTQHLRNIAAKINQSREKLTPLVFTESEIKLLTYYSARHTYATMLKKSNAPVSLISQALGHSDARTTQTYLDSFGIEEVDKFNDMIMY